MSRKEPQVTIFVPVKNAERTIEKCINSLLNLNYKNKKIFIIDNMSTDKTYEILKKFKKKIHLKRMKGRVPKLHNYILKNVKTKFLAYTNADCIVKKDWLTKLISGFTSSDIIATAGYCATPPKLNKFQTLIGLELESRFKQFPQFISRAPDMNLCVRTDVAKKVKFDERFIWSWESDFGYRLTKLGKMKYIPNAIVYHYHRPTWRSFFKQQFNNAKIQVLLVKKHFGKIKGDHISTPSMALQLLFAYLSIALLLTSIFFPTLFILFVTSFILLLLLYFSKMVRISKNLKDYPLLLVIFLTRTLAWMFGILVGLFLFIKNKWYR